MKPEPIHRLSDLLAGLPLEAEGDCELSEISDDSRAVTPGGLFIARTGEGTDGRAYVGEAASRGVAAVVGEGDRPGGLPSEVIWVSSRGRVGQALAGELAERFFGRPSGKLTLVGVTGTNGKTTTAWIARHLIEAGGKRCGLIGTVGVDAGARETGESGDRRGVPVLDEGVNTTPGAVAFSRLLSRMVENGCDAAVAEVSSHALAQGRVDALRFAVGVFTNLSGDHLDYHGTMEAYGGAKARLFERLPAGGWAVVNAGDAWAGRMVERFAGGADRVLGCVVGGGEGEGEAGAGWRGCTARVGEMSAWGSDVVLTGPWGEVGAHLALVGVHNVANALEATAASWAAGVRLAESGWSEALGCCPGVPGRLERVPSDRFPVAGEAGARPTVLVDYAHTDDALENVLSALRPVVGGRLIVVFGCGGDRDASKRPRMASAAERYADVVWVSSDNPRTERPESIIEDVLGGFSGAGAAVRVEPDRGRAIVGAIGEAAAVDTVLIAGKGHEDYQIVGREKRHFDDREEAARALGGR